VTSLVEALGDRIVGTVEEVSANRITVLLSTEAPQATALNTGVPAGFPRINGYVLIPNESGATVCIVSSVRVERLPFPKRRGTQKDFGLVDLPFPSRVMTLTPLGTLRARAVEGELDFEVRRGVDVFPSVGDPVLLPGRDQLRAIVEGENTENQGRILLGHCPTAGRAPVHVDPDKLFGRHLAVLGNTGAGKSCSVAGLVRWSLAAAGEERTRMDREGPPNARFIILDPNGEYAQAFKDLNARLFTVESKDGDRSDPLKVPAWLWNGEEWAAFAGAAPGVQRPVLFDALRRLRSGASHPDEFTTKVRGCVRRYRNRLKVSIQAGEHQQAGRREGVANILLNIQNDFTELRRDPSCSSGLRDCIDEVLSATDAVEQSARQAGGRTKEDGSPWHDDFPEEGKNGLNTVVAVLSKTGEAVGLADYEQMVDEDTPRPFPVDELPDFVEALAAGQSGRDVAQFVDTLNLRIRGLLSRGRLSSVLTPGDAGPLRLHDWLTRHIGADQAEDGSIVVIDLSLIPSEVIHIVVSVLARMVFEAVQRYRKEEGKELPTTLILEEAHTFVHRDLTKDGAPAAGRACARVFERIAREGRKFGLGLVLASQRPYEVSPTVLSQCNTFLLHRIVNDLDQELVKKLVPDGLGTLLRDLPSLPSRRAILLGWAAPAPVLVEINEVPEEQRPHSPDPAFWDVWTGTKERRIDWERIARDWQGGGDTDEPVDGARAEPPEIHAPEALPAEESGVDDVELPS
jgi:uncharacterized protein